MLSDQGNAEEIGGTRCAQGDTRGDHDGLLRGRKPFATGNATGAVDHVLEVMGILGHDAGPRRERAGAQSPLLA